MDGDLRPNMIRNPPVENNWHEPSTPLTRSSLTLLHTHTHARAHTCTHWVTALAMFLPCRIFDLTPVTVQSSPEQMRVLMVIDGRC